MRKLGIVLVLSTLIAAAAPQCHAGLFSKFNEAMTKLFNDYNQDMINEGQAIKDGFKNGGFNAALTGWQTAQQQTGANAKANLKAVAKGLLDFVFFIPRLIQAAFKAVADFVGDVLDQITGADGGGGGAQAPKSSFSAKSSDTDGGDDFLARFEAAPDLGKKLAMYVELGKRHLSLRKAMTPYLAKDDAAIARENGAKLSDVTQGKEEAKFKAGAVQGLLEAMEVSLAKTIAESDENLKVYENFRRGVDASIRYTVMPSLNMKVLQLRK